MRLPRWTLLRWLALIAAAMVGAALAFWSGNPCDSAAVGWRDVVDAFRYGMVFGFFGR